jgi:hypothetical protein
MHAANRCTIVARRRHKADDGAAVHGVASTLGAPVGIESGVFAATDACSGGVSSAGSHDDGDHDSGGGSSSGTARTPVLQQTPTDTPAVPTARAAEEDNHDHDHDDHVAPRNVHAATTSPATSAVRGDELVSSINRVEHAATVDVACADDDNGGADEPRERRSEKEGLRGLRRVHVVTNEVSRKAKCGDPQTNKKVGVVTARCAFAVKSCFRAVLSFNEWLMSTQSCFHAVVAQRAADAKSRFRVVLSFSECVCP